MSGNPLADAAAEVQQACDERDWRFCFIGGLAVVRWGEPRLTRDVDLTLITGYGEEASYVDALLERFPGRLDETRAFALDNRVLLLRATNGIPIDAALGALPFEERAVQRASSFRLADQELTVCSAEDLIVHKVFAGRPHDWADVEGVIARQGSGLAAQVILEELGPLLDASGHSERLRRLEAVLATRGS
ncbi:MAG: nucleotidyl transferase AbiEii/AbiGii toxin family protein [Egibacteraceae bacterium]